MVQAAFRENDTFCHILGISFFCKAAAQLDICHDSDSKSFVSIIIAVIFMTIRENIIHQFVLCIFIFFGLSPFWGFYALWQP